MSQPEPIEPEPARSNVRRLRPAATEAELNRAQLIEELTAPASHSIRRTRWVAGGAFILLFGLAAFVPISSGVVAPGQLATQVERQQIQHMTGGVIQEVMVREGAKVEAGQVLIKFAPLDENAAAGVAGAQLNSLEAQSAVRQAEIDGKTAVDFKGQAPAASPIAAAQQEAFDARKAKHDSDRAEIDAQRAQVAAAIQGSIASQTSLKVQIEKVDQELGAYRTLLEKGYVAQTRVWADERNKADLEGRLASAQADVSRMRAQDRELAARRAQIDLDAKVQAAEDLGTIQRDLAAAAPRFEAAADALKRTQITAPISGTVMHLANSTIGGVIRPGETIMEIVPDKGPLIVRARIRPQDADDVHKGLTATVRFDSLGSRYAPRLQGTVLGISADALHDDRTGQSYFDARVAVPEAEAKRLPPGAYEPGLPAEVLIQTGSHTVMAYLMGPIDRAAFSAMRN